MDIKIKPIGYAYTKEKNIPRHWSVSDVIGTLVIDEKYMKGLSDIQPDQLIVVLFYFHKSPEFTPNHLSQTPPHKGRPMGVFSICSPVRPNPLGMSVLKVLKIDANVIFVKGVDMIDKTPILDIKPHMPPKPSDQ